MTKWFLYIVECKNGSFYTGITTSISRRISEHNSGFGAKYVRGKLPVKLKYFEEFESNADAARREREIKSWRREKKLELFHLIKDSDLTAML